MRTRRREKSSEMNQHKSDSITKIHRWKTTTTAKKQTMKTKSCTGKETCYAKKETHEKEREIMAKERYLKTGIVRIEPNL